MKRMKREWYECTFYWEGMKCSLVKWKPAMEGEGDVMPFLYCSEKPCKLWRMA